MGHVAHKGVLAVVQIEEHLVGEGGPGRHEREVGGDGRGEVVRLAGALNLPADEGLVVLHGRRLGRGHRLAPLDGHGLNGRHGALGGEGHHELLLVPARREVEVVFDGGRERIGVLRAVEVPAREDVALQGGVIGLRHGVAPLHGRLGEQLAVGPVEAHGARVVAHDHLELDRGKALGHLHASGGRDAHRHLVGVRGLVGGRLHHAAVGVDHGGPGSIHALRPVDARHVETEHGIGAVLELAREGRGHEAGRAVGGAAVTDGHGVQVGDGDEALAPGGVSLGGHSEGAIVAHADAARAALGRAAEIDGGVCRVEGLGEDQGLLEVTRKLDLRHVGGAELGLAAHELGLVAAHLGPRDSYLHGLGRLGALGRVGERGRGGQLLARRRGVQVDAHLAQIRHVHGHQVDVVAGHRDGELRIVGVVLEEVGDVPQAGRRRGVPAPEHLAVGILVGVDGGGGALVVLGVALPVDGHLVGRGVGHLVELLLGGDVLQVEVPEQVEEIAAGDVVGELLGDEALRGHARAHADAGARGHLVLAAVRGGVGVDGASRVLVHEQVVGAARAAGVAVDAHHAVQVDVVLEARENAAALVAGLVARDRAVLDEVVAGRVVDGAALPAGLVARELAVYDLGVAAVEVDRAAAGCSGVFLEGAGFHQEVLAARVDGAAVALAVVLGEVAGLDGDLRGVGVDGAGLVALGPVAHEVDAHDLAAGVVAGEDAAAMLLLGGVVRDRRGAVADEVEVVVVEVDAATTPVGAHVGVVVYLGAVRHLDAGVGALAVDAGAVLAQVVADGAALHGEGVVAAAQVDAAAVAAVGVNGSGGRGVVADLGVGHIDGAAVAPGAHAAALRAVGLVARHGHVDELEGRAVLHLDAAGSAGAVAAGDQATGLEGDLLP